MAELNENGVDAHYAYFRNVLQQLGDSSVGSRVKNIYDYTKNSSPLVGKTLNGVEDRVVSVNGQVLAPIYANYLYPTTERLSQTAQSSIGKGANVFAGVKDLAQASTALGLGVAVVGAQVTLIVSATMTNFFLDGVILGKDVGSEIVHRTIAIEQQVQSRIFQTIENCKAIAGVPINKAAEYTNSMLDVMNAFLDNFLHLPVDETENPESTIPQRVSHLASRVGHAIVHRTVEPCQRQLANLVENLRQKLTLVDAVKKHGKNVKEQVLNTSLSDVYGRIEREAHELRIEPSAFLLKSIHKCANQLNKNLQDIRVKTAQTLPSTANEHFESAITYIENLDKTFENAHDINAIKEEVIEEAKQKINEVLQLARFLIVVKPEETEKTNGVVETEKPDFDSSVDGDVSSADQSFNS